MKSYEPRNETIQYLRKTLYGPSGGEAEEIEGTPLLRYMTGLLFPRGVGVEEAVSTVTATAEEAVDEADSDDESSPATSQLDLATESLPASVGLSFVVPDTATVRCSVWAGAYEPLEAKGKKAGRGGAHWIRKSLASKDNPVVVHLDRETTSSIGVLQDRALVKVRWRTRPGGHAIVTVSLVNARDAESRVPDPASTLFQVGLKCEVEGGFLPYPRVEGDSPGGVGGDRETDDAEVNFLYRSVLPFARGHGAAADWAGPIDGRAAWVAVDFIPAVDVPKATFSVDDAAIDPKSCDVEFLAKSGKQEVLGSLATLVKSFGSWVAAKRKDVPNASDPAMADVLVTRVESWLARMERGLELLRKDDRSWRCFQLANEAMGIQMALSRVRPKGNAYCRSEARARPAISLGGLAWRPFQIAFLLGVMESLVDDSSPSRETVDVIWFPTGGGKTEAYLLVSAFELIRRRLVAGDRDSATAIISRYTLRFLTVQQFQRTAALVVALEILRKQMREELGERPFTLGLWVGNSVTPGTVRKAHEKFQEQLESRVPRNPFILQSCPCCGTEIFPTRHLKGRTKWTVADFGVEARANEFFFRCASPACEFHDKLPLNVVDQELYREPPSLLLGTVDKFALLPWFDSSRTFFGGNDDQSLPPSLILQDELHLISGPLGSLAAPYDAALDTIIAARGPKAKRIGSTATIRNAREQVRGLYGRPVAVFPSPAGNWDDAFFFTTDRHSAGRTYVGVMGQGYIKPVVAMAWTSAALLQAVREVRLPPDALDAYWSLLAYHNSRRELGRTLTAARDEIQSRIGVVASSPAVARELKEPLELSANMVKSLGEAIEELERPHKASHPAVDFVPCTSIISVGVDLDRLGIMLVNGQPKLTSEYIQATSRVGRGKVPGLVVSLFSAAKPRDRSHYEDFRAYHEAIYRHVEPTSVTPYALPARERTLHAALVAVVRHATKYWKNEAAKEVSFDDAALARHIAVLMRVMESSDPSESAAVRDLLEQRLSEWKEEAESGYPLLYENRQAGHQFVALLATYGRSKAGALWPTMMSVRNVDAEVRLRVA